jgi:hypothetical protein
LESEKERMMSQKEQEILDLMEQQREEKEREFELI